MGVLGGGGGGHSSEFLIRVYVLLRSPNSDPNSDKKTSFFVVL